MTLTTAFAAALAAVCLATADAAAITKNFTKKEANYTFVATPTAIKSADSLTWTLSVTSKLTVTDTKDKLKDAKGSIITYMTYWGTGASMTAEFDVDDQDFEVCAVDKDRCWWPSTDVGKDGKINYKVTNGVADVNQPMQTWHVKSWDYGVSSDGKTYT